MAATLMTIPHAPIKRLARRDGTIDEPEIGSFVNVRGAQFVVDGRELTVDLGTHAWVFTCADHAEAQKFADLFATRGQR